MAPATISLGPILTSVRSFKSVFQSVCVFSVFSLIPCSDLTVHPPHITTKEA